MSRGFWCCVLGLIRVNTCVEVAASWLGEGGRAQFQVELTFPAAESAQPCTS